MTATPDPTRLGNNIIDWKELRPALRLTTTALLVAILVLADLAFSSIPYVQVVTFLLIYYFFLVGYAPLVVILLLYVSIDCLLSGGMWPIFISLPTMFLAWLSLISLLNLTKLIKGPLTKKLWLVALIAAVHGFIFGQTFAVVTTLIYHGTQPTMFYRGWLTWTMADIPWEIAQCVVGIASAVLLLPPVYAGTKRALRGFGK